MGDEERVEEVVKRGRKILNEFGQGPKILLILDLCISIQATLLDTHRQWAKKQKDALEEYRVPS